MNILEKVKKLFAVEVKPDRYTLELLSADGPVGYQSYGTEEEARNQGEKQLSDLVVKYHITPWFQEEAIARMRHEWSVENGA